ncbi:MAG TPA: lipopolysaccharide kinase InaA family protein [Candidatus Marinimicrobia bacterium]|nr:lipopolysaccharide kinase InaA family protein [Candidatus Neomarinimicrobiota bacterium]HRS52119.1 lipopolysaccharide kinase InaA family protein [Candidatus Neomarinimicrobiota bacterium]HRU92504.1 lipopolysaccharide kinase InaA family protein [Candidatus Neomarinimicrobiota bacterium]
MGYRALHGEKLTQEQLRQLCDRDWISTNAHHIYKDKVNILAEIELEINGVPRTVVIKWFGWRNRISYWLSPFMRSRAKKSWDASFSLLKCGVKVPMPITVYTRRRFGFIQRNFLLTEKIKNFTLARSWLRDPNANPDHKRIIVATIAEMIRKMHQAGMVHSDLTPGNFLVNNDNPAEIFLVDLNRLKHKIFLTRAQKMNDIAKLNLCRCNLAQEHSDCLWILFLEQYDKKELEKNKLALRLAISRLKNRRAMKALRKSSKSKRSAVL